MTTHLSKWSFSQMHIIAFIRRALIHFNWVIISHILNIHEII